VNAPARPRLARAAAVLMISAALAGCTADVSSRTTAVPTARPTATAIATTAPPTPSPTPTVTLASCPAAVDRGALHVVHRFPTSPDDVAVDAANRIWVTAREANLLTTLAPDGSLVSTKTVSGGPEGLAIDASGAYVAQQNLNAIAVVAPGMSTLLAFPNRTGNAGIDGIAIGTGGQLLVPDSPTGQLFSVDLQQPAAPHLVATGLGRPVDATTDAAGDIVVASESSPALVVLSANGGRRTLGRFADLDEVVEHAGLLYVTELDRHDVVAVDPVSGASRPIAVNLPAPQGLAVTAGGTLEIVDATTNTLYSMPACGVTG
jgi:DNA-binding beta-propeller fold protein YncE